LKSIAGKKSSLAFINIHAEVTNRKRLQKDKNVLNDLISFIYICTYVVAFCAVTWRGFVHRYLCFSETYFLHLQAAYSSETTVSDYRNTLSHNPEDHILNSHRCENLKTFNSAYSAKFMQKKNVNEICNSS
jgi:hypothetical protein